MTAEISYHGRVMPFGYTCGRDPITGLWVVKKGPRAVTRTQPSEEAGAAFARAHAEIHAQPERVDDDKDPGADDWTACPIRRALRQHRHEAETRTT